MEETMEEKHELSEEDSQLFYNLWHEVLEEHGRTVEPKRLSRLFAEKLYDHGWRKVKK